GVIADRAQDEGVEIPEFAPATVAALEAVLRPGASPRNPIDVTGYMLAHADGASPILRAIDSVSCDSNVDFVLYAGIVVPARPDPDLERRFHDAAAVIEAAPVPVLPATTTCVDLTDHARANVLERRL